MEFAPPNGGDGLTDSAPARPIYHTDTDLAVRQPALRVAESTADVAAAAVPISIESTTGGAKISREHGVKSGDTLWSIARSELKAANQPANGTAITNYINQIVEANKDHIPGLAKNRHKIDPSMKLAMPELTPGASTAEIPARLPGGRRKPDVEPAAVVAQPEVRLPKVRDPLPAVANPELANVRNAKDSPVHHPLFKPLAEPKSETIHASWYGGFFHGRKTANGERYDQEALTVAHKTLPFGTVVRFTNAKGDSIDARVTDRGPYIDGRDFDLSRGIARHMGLIDKGTGNLKATILGRGPRSIGGYWRT